MRNVKWTLGLAQPLRAISQPRREMSSHVRHDRPWYGGKILVAEDNYLLAELICDFLRECKLEPVGPANRVDEASKLAHQCALDGAVLDLKLRDVLCFPVCRILVVRRIPYIFLTGYHEQARLPVEFRGVPLIRKPFSPDEMKSALAAMLNRSEGSPFPGAGPVSHP